MRHCLIGAASCLALMTGYAQAQQVSSGEVSPSLALEEIVVTALRHTETAQRAAVSLTALSGDALRDQARDSIAAAIASVPAVAVAGNANGAQIYIRGVGSNADSQLGDPAVNLNVDGVYQQESEVPTSLMFDVNRIEVLRGPQGTLYGRNATAGAVNILTTDPKLGEVEGYATLQGGNYDQIHSEAAVNIPLGGTLAARAAFASERHSGYLSNGNQDADIKAGRLKVLYNPTDALRVIVAGDYMHSGGNDVGTVDAPLSSRADPYYSDKGRGYLSIDAWNVRGQADYDADIATFSLLAAHNSFAKDEANILLAPSGVADHRVGQQNSVEFRASSSTSSTVAWVAGLYYLDDLEKKTVITEPVSFSTTSASDPDMRDATIKTMAAFTNVSVPVTDIVRLTGGLRYTYDEKGATFYYADTSKASVSPSSRWGSITYKVGAEADVAANSLAYAQVSTGFKAGGYAQQFPAETYSPEKITAYEIGSKNRFADNRIQVNLSAFYYDYNNYQASYPDIVDGGFALVTKNAATAELYGAELETQFALTPDDKLGVGLTYVHAQFGVFTYTSILSGAVDHTGQALPNAPRLTAELSYEHTFQLDGDATVTAHVNSHISTGYWASVERTLDSYQPSFTRTDAFLAYEPEGKTWSARLFVHNLEDAAVRTLGLANPFSTVLMLAPPRTYGASVTVRF